MQMGIQMRAYPEENQKLIFSRWMGCDRVIWNAKCDEWKYQSTYARKYLPVGTYADIDASYSQYKDDELTPYLSQVPSQIARNAANRWRNTMRNWIDPTHPQKGPAKKKKKQSKGSVYLTKELFEFISNSDGSLSLHIGTKKFPVGVLKFKAHGPFKKPKSINIKKNAGYWWLSFNYEDGLSEEEILDSEEALKYFKSKSPDELEHCVVGVDRGVAVACRSNLKAFSFDTSAKEKQERRARYIKKQQRRLARQKKGSKRREKTKGKIARAQMRSANVRDNFCQQTSHALTHPDLGAQLIVMENLKTAQMTKRPKAKKNKETGKWEKNRAAQKAGLNRAILSIGWHKLETYTRYKAQRRGSLLVKISPQFSSQECADCGHIHPGNRKTQSIFLCLMCGHRDNADRNAALVLKKRAIKLLANSGTELSERGVMFLPDIGCGVQSKTSEPKARKRGRRSVKKEGKVTLSQKLRPFKAE